ncbi:MAG: hypothetical protein U9O89_04060 [Thermoproteota archaeon]|nr:hypothetical protein [Thermoproteota archaeon]
MKIQGRVTKDGEMLFPIFLSSESLKISNRLVVFELDTGASLTVMSDSDAFILELDYSVLPKIEPAYGIGGKCDVHVIEDAILRFISFYGDWTIDKRMKLGVLNHKVDEIEDEDVRRAVLACRSLVGRDILGRNFTIIRQENNVTINI